MKKDYLVPPVPEMLETAQHPLRFVEEIAAKHNETFSLYPLGHLVQRSADFRPGPWLYAFERFQQEAFGAEGGQVLPRQLLVAVVRAGGVVLGAYDTDVTPTRLFGCLIDLFAHRHGHPCRLTLLHYVAESARNCGIGYQLRQKEREVCRKDNEELITWMVDPLRGAQAHFAFNKLGAIATWYEREVYGELSDSANVGLATDRLAIEWWIACPRVLEIVDQGRLPYHYGYGFDRMEVVTKTGVAESGVRRLQKVKTDFSSDVLLFEIPVDLDRVRECDPDLARDWRVKTRDAFEVLFAGGYVLSGFVHEAGRSFHLFERAEKASLLRRTTRK